MVYTYGCGEKLQIICICTDGVWVVRSCDSAVSVVRKHCVNTNRYNTTQHNTSQHNTTQHDTTRHDTTRHDTTRRDATRRDATRRNATQHNTTQRNATQRNATQQNTTQHNATQRNTTQHNTTQHTSYTPFVSLKRTAINKLHAAQCSWRSQQLHSQSANVKQEGSLPCAQQPSNCPYPELDEPKMFHPSGH